MECQCVFVCFCLCVCVCGWISERVKSVCLKESEQERGIENTNPHIYLSHKLKKKHISRLTHSTTVNTHAQHWLSAAWTSTTTPVNWWPHHELPPRSHTHTLMGMINVEERVKRRASEMKSNLSVSASSCLRLSSTFLLSSTS